MAIVIPYDKHQQIIQDRVLPKILEIFPNDAKCEINPGNEKECVNVAFRILLPDDPTKPPENKYNRIIIRFSKDLIDDYLDPENKSAIKHYDSVIKRIYDYIKDEYSRIKNQNIDYREFYEMIVSEKALNLVV